MTNIELYSMDLKIGADKKQNEMYLGGYYEYKDFLQFSSSPAFWFLYGV